nr:MAG TPA: hypothetical protein [Caudoviricetes sp.]
MFVSSYISLIYFFLIINIFSTQHLFLLNILIGC